MNLNMYDTIKACLWRLRGWWIVSLVAFVIIAIISPQQVGVLIYKTLLVVFGVGLSYLADKVLFMHATTIETAGHDVYGAARLLSRALVALAVLIALSMGI